MLLRPVLITAATVLNLTVACAIEPLPAAWSKLEQALQQGNSSDHRRQALAALGTISGPNARAVKLAEDALRDKDPLVRQSAALALGDMKAKEAVPALKESLGDTGEVAFAAAKALTDIGDPGGRDMLIAVLAGERKDTPGMITNAVREAKKRLRHPEGIVLMGAENAAGYMFGPAEMGLEAAMDTKDLKSKGAPGRVAAVMWLARDPDPYAVTLLEWALTDDTHLVRMEAAKGLGERGNAGSFPKLQYLLEDSHPGVRAMAAAAIIRISSREPGERSQ